ncbi:hypothetical protein BsWGS_25727 [Bradybaena similaris]
MQKRETACRKERQHTEKRDSIQKRETAYRKERQHTEKRDSMQKRETAASFCCVPMICIYIQNKKKKKGQSKKTAFPITTDNTGNNIGNNYKVRQKIQKSTKINHLK